MKPKLYIYDNIEELTAGFIDHLAELISQSKSEKFNINLSGGSTPKKLFDRISENYASAFDWQRINLWWGDERCVPPDDPESNFGMTKKHLINNIDIPAENIFRIRGEDDPAAECARYSKLIMDNVTSKQGNPVFDTIILGLGADGHIASIFPDQIHLFDSANICETAVHPETGQERITITGKVINRAKNVFVLLNGSTKSYIVRIVINDEFEDELPVDYISPIAGTYSWFMDREAASELDI
jgi:6-phosphogluconolactonase